LTAATLVVMTNKFQSFCGIGAKCTDNNTVNLRPAKPVLCRANIGWTNADRNLDSKILASLVVDSLVTGSDNAEDNRDGLHVKLK